MLAELDFRGKAVVVTGAANGIGHATCEVFVELGARVFGVDIAPHFEQTFPAELPQAVAIRADVADEVAVRRMQGLIAEEQDELAAVVNVVGAGSRSPIETMAFEEWQRVIALTLSSTFLVTRALVPMVARGAGAFVNVASTHAFVGLPLGAAYSASKAGVVGLTRQLAVELGPSGVRVNCVCPGPVATKGRTVGHSVESTGSTVLGRPAAAREIANAIAFLASPAASFVTGAALVIDGGQTAHRGLVDASRLATSGAAAS